MREASLDLEEAGLFQGLSADEMSSVRERVGLCAFKPGDVLMELGRDSPGLYIIRSGLAAVVVQDSRRREREVYSLGKGECVGEMSLVTGDPCSATVRAITDTESWLIQASDFAALVERCPTIWRNLSHILSQKLVRTGRHLTSRSYTNAVLLMMDCADDEAAGLGIAITAGLARMTGRRTILIDGRRRSACTVSQLAPFELAPGLSDVLGDAALLKRHEAPLEQGNGLAGARLAMLCGEQGANLTDDEILTALERLHPHYDHILLLVDPEADGLRAALFERARSVLALTTQGEAGVPSWVDGLCRSPAIRERLAVAMMTGKSTPSTGVGAVEQRVGKPVRRLSIDTGLLRRMATEKAFLADVPAYLRLRKAVDRLGRYVGEMEVGLALGAGGAKGFAHVGVLKVLEENAVPVDFIAGCSIGAIVGALYAAGWSLPEIRRHLTGADRKVVRWTLPFRSVWSDAGLKQILQSPGANVRFRDLRIPFAAVATDIATGREVVLRRGLVWKAVQASVSIPGIFPPVIISDRHLVDGGLVNPVPSQTVRELGANIVVAVDLMSPAGIARENAGLPEGSGSNPATRIPNLVEILWRSTEIMQEEVTIRSAATADVTIEPKLGRVRWSDFSQRGEEFVVAGEEAARQKLPDLRQLLPFAISSE